MADLYLASRSARRRDLLKQINVRFEPLLLRLALPRGPDVEESQHSGESPADYVERTAREKAERGLEVLNQRHMLQRPILAADTVVIIEGEVIGKPTDIDQAGHFLRRLAGRSHEVRTAVVLASNAARKPQFHAAVSVSQVRFSALSDEQIRAYCRTGEPFDKAGGYAIQGGAAAFIEHIEGSYSGVMGLPLFETSQLLRHAALGPLA
jgi:septum formation protein